MSVVQQGMLVIADIGGYTRYLSSVELEHSHDILADLIGVVTARMERSLKIAKLEGDAVFCFGTDAELLEDLHDCHADFTRRQRTIALNTTCSCDACRRIPELELKFVAHHGSFVEHEVAGGNELVGPDVIVVHRMLKNSVSERYGMRAYALLSDACLTSLSADTAGLREHRERFGDIGEIHGAVIDLRESASAAPAVKLADGDAVILLSQQVAAPVPRTWQALTDAAEQLHWRVRATSIESDGEPGLGTKTHCVHGKTTFTQEIVDWQPQRYYSFTERTPIGRILWTVELEPWDSGVTRVIWRIALAGGRGQRMLNASLFGRRMRSELQANMTALAQFLDAGDASAA
jgi:uncharacterized protein YndB with AHSA1/START domain